MSTKNCKFNGKPCPNCGRVHKDKTGKNNPFYGKKHIKESLIKMSESSKGRIASKETREKMSRIHKGKKLGENNPMWKGDKVSFNALHEWIRNHKPKIELCERCKKEPSYDLANISGEYKRDINDFEWLCRSCHMNDDGRINNLKQYQEECHK